ncbi:MAG: YfbK domain-containing protein [Flavisolibacter sp.]
MRTLFLSTMLILFSGLAGFGIREMHTVTGNVTDAKGRPLSGVSVVEKGGSHATQSGADGNFRLSVENKDAVLVFSAIGYATRSIKLKGREVIHVELKQAEQNLEEVVVTGYGLPMAERSLGKQALPYTPGPGQGSPGYGTNGEFNTESYDPITENAFHRVIDDPLSTFSIDVDGASYSNVRRFLNAGQLPPAGAVRIEELINYFPYDYPQPAGPEPFQVQTELSGCPWNSRHQLVMIGLQGKIIPAENLPPSNLVFLIDVSGSMMDPLKLPLVKKSLQLLTDQLREEDRISIVVYAGNAGLVLPATSGSHKTRIREAIDAMEAGGSTAGGQGIRLAYKVAAENFMKKGNNRIILCTDGDFNIGASSNAEMEKLIEQERKTGIFLTVLGYGMGNYKDSKMEILADKGNGNHAYIDGIREARKVLVNEFGGTLFTIAKDVKLQVEFNPAKVQGYRLVGYENRMLQKQDFNDDQKDAGELGSGHTVTALYEIIPAGVKDSFLKDIDPLTYQGRPELAPEARESGEIMRVKLRYKHPQGEKSLLIEKRIGEKDIAFAKASDNFRFASSVAEFGMLLRNSEFRGKASFSHVWLTAKAAVGRDDEGYRKEFLSLVKKAEALEDQEEDKLVSEQ